jgi:hypothetical protein
MALKDLWNTSRAECEARTIQQIISWAGSLRDGSPAATDFREYLDLIPASLLSRYCDQCLTSPFQDSGLALQDLINHVGKRLGFDVEFGRYRGTQNSIGFDGIWKFPSGHCAVIEVKTTSAYQLRLETIAKYRLSLIEQTKLEPLRDVFSERFQSGTAAILDGAFGIRAILRKRGGSNAVIAERVPAGFPTLSRSALKSALISENTDEETLKSLQWPSS